MLALSSTFLTVATIFVAFSVMGWVPVRVDRAARPWTSTLPVLGGTEPPTHAFSRFHIRYYPMALLFIAFEMEMMFMYPWAVVFVREGGKALVEMGMFLGLLSAGILYAAREGALGWQ